jgi:phosphotransferase system  glucose/maltose/N-acetylglucosamine-specific IIC component
MNRKKTFNANNNKIFSAVSYTIMVVVLIIVETIIGTPLGDALLKASNGVLGDWAYTISMIMYSMADFVIVFIMDKFVIMRHKEEKKEESEEAPADETPATDATEEIAEDAPALEEAAADQE